MRKRKQLRAVLECWDAGIRNGATRRQMMLRATSSEQDRSFLQSVISTTLLEEAMEWIASNLAPNDVFDESDLRDWAEENGYVQEE